MQTLFAFDKEGYRDIDGDIFTDEAFDETNPMPKNLTPLVPPSGHARFTEEHWIDLREIGATTERPRTVRRVKEEIMQGLPKVVAHLYDIINAQTPAELALIQIEKEPNSASCSEWRNKVDELAELLRK